MSSRARMRFVSLLVISAWLGGRGARAGDLMAAVDLARCGGSPAGAAEVVAEGDHLRFDIRAPRPDVRVQIAFAQAQSWQGRERLVLEGRAEESTGLRMTVASLALVDGSGESRKVYEPDLIFPPEWNQRTLLLRDFEAPVPEQVRGVALQLWLPEEVGKLCRLRIRRCEALSREQVAAALQPPEGPPPMARAPQVYAGGYEHQRWTSFGPGGGGWYRTVAISPHDGTCFIGGDVGGVYRSRDRCDTWEMCNQGLTNLYVQVFAFDPSDPEVIYVGTCGGVFRSTDGGDTWSPLRVGFPPLMTFGLSAPISALAVHPERPDLVLAGVGLEREYGTVGERTVGGRIFRSTDGGASWTAVDLPGGEEARRLAVISLQFDPRDPEVVYATTQRGLFVSEDAGASWQTLGSGLEGYATTFLALRRDDPQALLLGYSNSARKRGGVLSSSDGGRTWTPAEEGLPASSDAWRLVPDPGDSATCYLGFHRGSGLFVTRDWGQSWHPLNLSGNLRSAWFFPGANVTGLDVDPRDPTRIIYVNDMDIYQSTNGGVSWEQVATNLVRPATEDEPARWRGRGCEILCMGGPQALAVDPSDPKIIYFGYWDAHAWKSEDGGQTCYRLTNGIDSGYGRMGCVVLDPDDPRIVYLSKGRNQDQQRIYKSVNGGREFHVVGHEGSGLPPGGVFSLVIDPTSPLASRTLFAAVTGYGVYRSDDGGLSWRAASAGLPEENRNVLQVAMDPTDPRRLVAIAGAQYSAQTRRREPGYIARSTDGAESWQVVKSRVEPQCVLVDPFDPRRIYVGNRNFSGVDYPNALYISEDGGDSWISLDQSQFLAGPGSRDGDQGARVLVSCLAADPTRPGRLYAACREESYDVNNGRGVFVSDDWGLTWQPFPHAGLSNYRIGTLIVDPTNPARLYAGTSGNGVFRFGPPPE